MRSKKTDYKALRSVKTPSLSHLENHNIQKSSSPNDPLINFIDGFMFNDACEWLTDEEDIHVQLNTERLCRSLRDEKQ